MNRSCYTLLILFCFCGILRTDAQTASASTKQPGIINGRAISLPLPKYPEDARRYCAKGKVEIDVSVDASGNVVRAVARSGDALLFESAIDAAKHAKFRPTQGSSIQTTGILVYNFDSLSKCPRAGIVNKKALSIPKPILVNFGHPHLTLLEEQVINVSIVIDESGNVIATKAISGHILVRAAFERSASGAKFPPTLINTSRPLRVKAVLQYILKPNGEIVY